MFQKVLSYAKDYRKKTYLAIALILLSVVCGILPYVVAYDLIIHFVEGESTTVNYLLMRASAIFLLLLFKSILFSKGLDASHHAAYDTLMGMRMRFADKMTKLPLGQILNKGSGSYKKHFVDDIEEVEILLAHAIPEGIPYVAVVLVIYIVLFFIDWRLALLTLASLPIGMWGIVQMMKTGKTKMKKYYESGKNMNNNIVEYIAGMEVVKVFNHTVDSFEKFKKSVEDYKEYTVDWYKTSWNYMALCTAVLPSTIMFLLPGGIMLYVNETLELSTFVFSILLALSIGSPLVNMMSFASMIPKLKYKIELLESMFEGEEIIIKEGYKKPKDYTVEFKDVYFAYEEKEVIKGITFAAKVGETTALVGESGSGKSTLAKLLLHFWDIKSGEIRLGGVDIKEMSTQILMESISYVAQDSFLFNTTVMENIRIGKPEASDQEVIEASKKAMCNDFILELENGYDTICGDEGDKLSGGQKQRISLARVILKNAPIVVLDEATAFSDPENEGKIQAAINELVRGKTLIVIAHRLSTVAHAENMLLMEDGKLEMTGTHEYLLKNSPKYKVLWNSHIESMNWKVSNEGDEDYAKTN